MRIVYLGTPDFAVAPLKAIVEKGYEVVGVVTNRDKETGRKKVLTPPPVKVYANGKGIPVFQYTKIRLEGVLDLKALKPDLLITCAFGQILSQEIIDIAKYGVINIHASLLPKYRGASPIHFAILNGEKQTGITIMKTDIGIDTGDILFKREVSIGEDETCGELFERLSVLGAECILTALPLIESGKAVFKKQDEKEATYSKLITKDMARIDFNRSAIEVKNQVRAFNPSPVAFTFYNGELLKIYQVSAINSDTAFAQAGTVLEADKQLIVACKTGAVEIKVLQKAGGNKMSVSDFLRGNRVEKGSILSKW